MGKINRLWKALGGKLQNQVPAYGQIYFDSLYAEYCGLPAEATKERHQTLVEEIVKKSDAGVLTWRDVYTFDLVLARLQPPEKLRQIVLGLRSRYRQVAGLRDYEAYIASKPPDPETQPAPTTEVMKADIEFLLRELHLRYAITPIREQIREKLSSLVWWITLIGLVAVIIYVTLLSIPIAGDTGDEAPAWSWSAMMSAIRGFRPSALLVTVFAGMMGGLMSVQQRFQSFSQEGDPLFNVSELIHGSSSILLAPLSGAIFAVVLYLMLAGGLLGGSLFPAFPPETANNWSVIEVMQHTGPNSFADYSKLIVWSFIAGFAERLVPDTLTRIVEKARTARGAAD